jgi:hypothetical protein
MHDTKERILDIVGISMRDTTIDHGFKRSPEGWKMSRIKMTLNFQEGNAKLPA